MIFIVFIRFFKGENLTLFLKIKSNHSQRKY